jgi:hypothetical protein
MSDSTPPILRNPTAWNPAKRVANSLSDTPNKVQIMEDERAKKEVSQPLSMFLKHILLEVYTQLQEKLDEVPQTLDMIPGHNGCS